MDTRRGFFGKLASLFFGSSASAVAGMRDHIGTVEAIDRERWQQMQRSVNPVMTLNFSEVVAGDKLSDAETARIRTEWEKQFQGSNNPGRLLVVPRGSRLS